MAQESGVPTPTAAEVKQFDRARQSKRVSNAEWVSPTDPEAKITRMPDGRTRLAYKPEHAVDLDTEAIVAAVIHSADQGDTTSIEGTLEAAARGLDAAGSAPTADTPAELIGDKGYHSRAVLKTLDDGPWRTRIAEPKPKDVQRWRGELDARRAVYGNPTRLRSGVGKEALKLRAERVERSFEHTLDRGGMRRAWLRGRENLQKRYLVHVAAYNLGLVMRALLGTGTPRELAAKGGLLWSPLPLDSSSSSSRRWTLRLTPLHQRAVRPPPSRCAEDRPKSSNRSEGPAAGGRGAPSAWRRRGRGCLAILGSFSPLACVTPRGHEHDGSTPLILMVHDDVAPNPAAVDSCNGHCVNLLAVRPVNVLAELERAQIG